MCTCRVAVLAGQWQVTLGSDTLHPTSTVKPEETPWSSGLLWCSFQVLLCSLAADVFTAGVAGSSSVDIFNEAWASFLLLFGALLPPGVCLLHGSKPGSQLPAVPPGRSAVDVGNLQLAQLAQWTKFGWFHSTGAALLPKATP